jgi:hypothetical protein
LPVSAFIRNRHNVRDWNHFLAEADPAASAGD